MPTSALRRSRSTRHRTAWTLAVAMVVIGACDGGDPERVDDQTVGTPSGSVADAGGLTVELSPADGEPALGEPTEVTVTVANAGARSVSAPVELSLVTPDGREIAFHRTSLFVPFGESTSESVSVTTTRWSGTTGRFEVRAAVTEAAFAATGASTAFTVMPTDRTIPTFEDVTESAGVLTDVPAPACGQFANGAAWGDVDGDGWPDLAVTRLGQTTQLFMNRTDGTFADESVERGVAIAGANGAAFADYDDDGDEDLVLVGDGSDVLLRNDGTGRFDDVTAGSGIAGDPSHRGIGAAWGDYDGDGLLDLYVTNYMECTGPWVTEQDIIANVAYHPDVLYHNEGDGTFADVTDELPERDESGAGFTAAWLDVDGDGLLDLYLGNDFVGLSPDHNRLWRNTGPGGSQWTFADESLASGAGLYLNTMGIGIADVDHDGDADLALSNIGGNKLLRSDGDGTFTEQVDSGIERPMQGVDHTTVTWGTVFADFDLDGWDDLFLAAGNLPQGDEVVVGEQPDMLFLNDGRGERFLDVSALTGVDDLGDSKGVAVADYDLDGLVDMFVVGQGGRPHLYRNTTPRHGRHWLELDLTGTGSNTDACGARVELLAGGDTITRFVLCGSGATGSAHDRRVHVGLGAAESVESVAIVWPSGRRQVLDGVAVDQVIDVEEPAG